MNIIVVFDRIAKGKTLTLSRGQTVALLALLLLAPLLLAGLLYYFTLVYGSLSFLSPYLQSLMRHAQYQVAAENRDYMQQNLNIMALTLGQLQAQMLRMNALGERLAKVAGISKQEFAFDQLPGRGGAESLVAAHDWTEAEFKQQLGELTRSMEEQADRMVVLESMLMQEQIKKNAVPTGRPVNLGWFSSDFGWRIDPFTGRHAFHEGVDFVVPIGTVIRSAAGGIVVYSDFHPSYGNMVEIDHGNGLTSRYAHCSRRFVKAGDIVLRGQKIAESGNSGRSSGPHLHFEVRYKGIAQNPARYLDRTG